MNEKIIPTASINLDAANALIDATIKAASAAGIEAAVAVTDAAGNLRAFKRTDGTPFLAVDVSIDKAWTAASFGYPTHVWNEYIADPKVAPLSYRPRMMPVGGGFPILHEGQLVGGLGVSGGSYQQDQNAAETALKSNGFESAW